MSDLSIEFSKGNLVIYKEKPAIVIEAGAKLEIRLESGKTIKVRPKDIEFLHAGPLTSFSQLTTPKAIDINEIRTILAGETTTLTDLMELSFEEDSPGAAWAIYELLVDGLYFTGTIDAIHPNTDEEFEAISSKRNAKENDKKEWDAFIERARHNALIDTDNARLQSVCDVAFGTSTNSKILKELDIESTPELAHQLLLKLKHWDSHVNPYIRRLGFTTDIVYPEMPPIKNEERLDLTHLAAYAIDDEGNKDPDDAISFDNGTLWIHIADVASLVTPDSPLDLHAKSHAANLYLPEITVSMLPAEITALFGLGISEISPALSFGITLKENGEINTVRIHPTLIKVTRTTYAAVETTLEQSPFKEMLAMARRYQYCRESRGAVSISFPEVKIKVVDGVVTIKQLPDCQSQVLVSNAMMMAGEAAARFAGEHALPFLYTTQPPPDISDIPEAIRKPQTLSEMFAFRKFLKPGQIKSVAEPHAGLGLSAYSRTTSPIRRYVDLIAHQQIRTVLQGTPPLDEQQIINRAGSYEALIGSITKLERLSNRHWTLVYLMQNPHWEGKGIIVDIKERFAIVLIPELALESRIPLSPDFEVDQEIVLSVKRIDLPHLEVFFNISS